MVWALQQARGRANRFPEETCRYLMTKFDFSEVTGNKADPQQVLLDMRCAKDMKRTWLFQREQWSSKSQIKFFSPVSAARRKKKQLLEQSKDTDAESEDIDCWVEELSAAEEEKKQNDFLSEVE